MAFLHKNEWMNKFDENVEISREDKQMLIRAIAMHMIVLWLQYAEAGEGYDITKAERVSKSEMLSESDTS